MAFFNLKTKQNTKTLPDLNEIGSICQTLLFGFQITLDYVREKFIPPCNAAAHDARLESDKGRSLTAVTVMTKAAVSLPRK